MNQLWANICNNLKLYRRNKLLLGGGVILLLMIPLMNADLFFMMNALERFDLLALVFDIGNWIFYLFIGATGLITVSEPYNERSIKLALTRPVSPVKWLGSHFATAFLLAFTFYIGFGLVTQGLGLVLGVEYYSGFWFLTLNWICRALILFSVLLVLSFYMRPILAAVFALVFNPVFFKQFAVMFISTTSATIQLGHAAPWLKLGSYLTLGFYLLLPAYTPLAGELEKLYMSHQLEATGDWWYLLPIVAYTLLIMAFSFCFSLFVLRNRDLS